MEGKRFLCGGVAVLALLLLTACAGNLFPTFGRMPPSDKMTQAFESHSVNPDYNYFYSGCDDHPNVVVGLHRDYRMNTFDLWKPVAMSPARMAQIVEGMRVKANEGHHFLYGFDMHDPQGRPIGAWYSLPSARTCLEILPDGSVRIDPPDIDTFDLMNQDAGWSPMNG